MCIPTQQLLRGCRPIPACPAKTAGVSSSSRHRSFLQEGFRRHHHARNRGGRGRHGSHHFPAFCHQAGSLQRHPRSRIGRRHREWCADAEGFMDARRRGPVPAHRRQNDCGTREDPRFERLMIHAALEGHELAVMHHDQINLAIGARHERIYSRLGQRRARSGSATRQAVLFAVAGAAKFYAIQKYMYRLLEETTASKEQGFSKEQDLQSEQDEQMVETFVSILMQGLRGDTRGKSGESDESRSGGCGSNRGCTGLGACGSKTSTVQAVSPDAVKPIAVVAAAAVTREVPADFEETGTFVADESSDIAPPVAGRVIATPVDVGAHVRRRPGHLRTRSSRCRTQAPQARAQLQEATARSAPGAIPHRAGASGDFDPDKVPEVAAAPANYRVRAGAGENGGGRRPALRQSRGHRRRFAAAPTKRPTPSRRRRKPRPTPRASSTKRPRMQRARAPK